MKLQIVLLVIIFSMTAIYLYAGDFILGAYLYNKNYDYAQSNHTDLCNAMSAAGFNTAICSAQDDTTYSSADNMLGWMGQANINGILEDFIFDPPSGNYGAKTLSTGNYFRFEAEYSDSTSISSEDLRIPDKFYYKSSNWNDARIGTWVDGEFSNDYCWFVDDGESGYAYYDLTYKWPQPNNLSQYRRIGNEFRFPNSRTGNYDLFNANVLYITYAMQCPDADTLPAGTIMAEISLTCKGKYTNSSDPTIIIPHDYGAFSRCDTTYVTKEMYLNSPVDADSLRFITVSVLISELNSNGVLLDGPNYTKMIVNLNPHFYWKGQGRLILDYIDFDDKLHKEYTNQEAILAQMRTFNLPYLYGYDEPAQGQFDSFNKISRYLENHGNTTQMVAAVYSYPNVVKTNYNSEQYKHGKAFIDAAQPQTYVIDEYALKRPAEFWENPDWSFDWIDKGSDSFIQKFITRMCNDYKYYKDLCVTNGTAFFVVPQTFGRWNPTEGKWGFIYPPDKVIKSLQLLPLCYQAQGIIDFKFAGSISNLDTCNVALINNYNGSYYTSNQYYAIQNANKKIKVYEPIIKDFEWLGTEEIMTWSSPNVSNVYLDSLYIPPINNPSLYQGWIHTGFYKDYTTGEPYLMLVNRRAITTENDLRRISPTAYYPSSSPLQVYNNSYDPAPPQTVRLFPSLEGHTSLSTNIGFYDCYDSTLYKPNGVYTDIEIGPGDGMLVQMVGTLPETVTENAIIKHTGYIDGSVTISNNAIVTFDSLSVVTLMDSTIIRVSQGSSLIIKGDIILSRYSKMIADTGGEIVFDNADGLFMEDSEININGSQLSVSNSVLKFHSSSSIIVNDGGELVFDYADGLFMVDSEIHITDSRLSITASDLKFSSTSGIFAYGSNVEVSSSNLHCESLTHDTWAQVAWNGIDSQMCNVNINNSTITNAETAVYVKRGSLTFSSSNIIFYSNGDLQGPARYGIIVEETQAGSNGHVTITGSPESRSLIMGYEQKCSGISIGDYEHPVRIDGIDLIDLENGITYIGTLVKQDSISNCLFNNCKYGISISGNNGLKYITNCTFNCSEEDSICIKTSTYQPYIRDCSFIGNYTNNFADELIGIQLDAVSGNLCSGQTGDIHNCLFQNIGTAIDSRESNSRLTYNVFMDNNYGLSNHSKSFLNCSSSAKNHFQNLENNIRYSDGQHFYAAVQLKSGHNDFYHTGNSVDFEFVETYDFGDRIDANYNYWQADSVRVKPSDKAHYIDTTFKDESPNLFYVLPDSRFATAMAYEDSTDYIPANIIYKNILIDRLVEEKKYWGASVNGVYKTALFGEVNLQSILSFYQAQIDVTPIEYKYLSLLMQDYMAKIYIQLKEYQNAADLISSKLENPESELDSLNAVLDLEIVYHLQSLEETRAPLITNYTQYQYPDFDTYNRKHNEHWNMLHNLLNRSDDSIPIPPIPTLNQNYPNPFNPSTTISFSIPARSNVKINIYNIKGQLVKTLINESFERGIHRVVWDGDNNNGNLTGSGIYLIKMTANGKTNVKKAMMLK